MPTVQVEEEAAAELADEVTAREPSLDPIQAETSETSGDAAQDVTETAQEPNTEPITETPELPTEDIAQGTQESSEELSKEERQPEPDVTVTRSSTPLSFSSSLPRVASPLSSASTTNLKAAANPPPKLTPPPAIKFESTPVQWKGLPMEAAVWTFDSKELQAIVSRAIRSSAKESYIRLLAIDILDNVLPSEVERLEAQKTMTQAKYRFLVHRRTMQLQALLSSSLSPRNAKETEEGIPTTTKLVVQISETTAECDLLMEELLKITDQLGQIKKLLDHHWASALAIALRKLNGSYGRRTSELSVARERIAQLEAELDDAWAEAEKLAHELDDLQAGYSDEDEAIIETAERVNVTPGPDSRPMSPTILTYPPIPSSPTSTERGHHHRVSVGSSGISPTASTGSNKLNLGSSQPQLPPHSPVSPLLIINGGVPKRQSKGIETPVDVPDNVSIKSSRSTKSARSYKSISRETTVTRASVVSAAKKRSLRASQSSLRLPPGFANGHKRSGSRPKTPFDTEDQPPVPSLPLHFASPVMHSHSSNASSALLHFDNASITDGGHSAIQFRHNRRTSLDSHITSGRTTANPWSGSAMDDINYYRDDEIQVVPRTPPPVVPPKIISMEEYAARPRPKRVGAKPESEAAPVARQNIPSIWMNVDAPKTPAERVETLMRNSSKGKTYQRLRGLTKRYSLPFPLFSSKANSSQQTLNSRATSQRSG
ncbi:hypothetical protein CC2G_011985 [Coprinopsis cinerea AmutBmut pab1-1]|nr:hypothetical protein CC2G_011985 [Coprinopsis cinerea AmutBmut pab1-1]